jgi:hypothetical protein
MQLFPNAGNAGYVAHSSIRTTAGDV